MHHAQAVRDGEREVRELVAGRERDERAISLATPYYDVVRQKHGESDEESEEANEVAVDYLTQFMPLVTGTRAMNRQEALEVRERSLKVCLNVTLCSFRVLGRRSACQNGVVTYPVYQRPLMTPVAAWHISTFGIYLSVFCILCFAHEQECLHRCRLSGNAGEMTA